ncbi:hypothetical protein FNV43_RR14827 [Rhamnella rubrinervis]|uniref:Uncharacterized protein n=1 Tax=Rhamnella rubrinervis TaxID=2594499 RepID=A0A8K0H3U1_9ROSA|nr:hypothetical protein FNV43_RR14827 [Rhamnella rubrinervis]
MNMRMKVTKNTNAKAWPWLTAGHERMENSFESETQKRMPKSGLLYGLRYAPEMCPVDDITTISACPAAVAFPIKLSTPLCFWFTMGAAAAENITWSFLHPQRVRIFYLDLHLEGLRIAERKSSRLKL